MSVTLFVAIAQSAKNLTHDDQTDFPNIEASPGCEGKGAIKYCNLYLYSLCKIVHLLAIAFNQIVLLLL